VVDEGPLAVDLDDRDPLAIDGLERRIARDVHLGVGRSLGVQDVPRAIAQVAALRRVEDD
jgi:hypothetical protein